MEDEETILSDAASGVVSVLHVKNVPIYLLPKVFEEAMKLVRQYTVPFDPRTLDTSDTSEDSEDTFMDYLVGASQHRPPQTSSRRSRAAPPSCASQRMTLAGYNKDIASTVHEEAKN